MTIEKAKDLAQRATDKVKDAATRVGEKVKEAGQKITDNAKKAEARTGTMRRWPTVKLRLQSRST